VLALVCGLLSLAAFPLTPGAIGRWPLILDLLASEPRTAWVLILAGVGVCVGILVGVRACLGDPQPEVKDRHFEALVSVGFALLALWLIRYFVLHPAPWFNALRQALAEFTFLLA
jgi:hypothetical protein